MTALSARQHIGEKGAMKVALLTSVPALFQKDDRPLPKNCATWCRPGRRPFAADGPWRPPLVLATDDFQSIGPVLCQSLSDPVSHGSILQSTLLIYLRAGASHDGWSILVVILSVHHIREGISGETGLL
jgi:hypothetical protein